MSELIINNFRGSTITLAITGIPVLITGTVLECENNIISIKTDDNLIIHIDGNLISFFF